MNIVGANPVSTVLSMAVLALTGEIHEARGNLEKAIEVYSDAVKIEDQNNYTEPPLAPTHATLFRSAPDAGRASEAEAV